MLRIENLTKSFQTRAGRHYLFKDVSIQFPEDANIAILGPNGAGKSTLLRILGGIDFPDAGRVVCDKTISWPLGIGGGFIGHLTGRENCELICRIYGLDRKQIAEKLGFIKEFSGLGQYFDEPIEYYSTGMNGRLNFTLSMAFEFDYFLIDEIISVGDRHFREQTKQALENKLSQSRVIMASHSVGTIRDFCDVALFLKDGELQVFDNLDAAIKAYFPQEAPKEKFELSRLDVDRLDLFQQASKREASDPVVQLKHRLNGIIRELKELVHEADEILDEARFCHLLGVILFRIGKWHEALDYHRQAISLHQENLNFYPAYISCLLNCGYIEEAETWADRVLDWANEPPAILAFKADILLRKGNNLEAEGILLKLVGVESTNSQRWNRLATALFLNQKLDEALKAQIRAIQLAPETPAFYDQLSRILFESDRVEEALEAKLKFGELSSKPVPAKDWVKIFQEHIRQMEDALSKVK